MTQTQHFTTAATWTVPANITRARAVVAGGAGGDATGTVGTGGSGAILSKLLAVSGSLAVAPGSIAGGTRGSSSAGSGGAGSVVADIFAGGGGGSGCPLYPQQSGAAAYPGGYADAENGSDGQAPFDTAKGKGAVGATGGAGGTRSGSSSGGAGQSHASGGKGGDGGTTSSYPIGFTPSPGDQRWEKGVDLL